MDSSQNNKRPQIGRTIKLVKEPKTKIQIYKEILIEFNKKIPWAPISYVTMQVVVLFIIFYNCRQLTEIQNNITAQIFLTIIILTFISYFMVNCKDPGYVKKGFLVLTDSSCRTETIGKQSQLISMIKQKSEIQGRTQDQIPKDLDSNQVATPKEVLSSQNDQPYSERQKGFPKPKRVDRKQKKYKEKMQKDKKFQQFEDENENCTENNKKNIDLIEEAQKQKIIEEEKELNEIIQNSQNIQINIDQLQKEERKNHNDQIIQCQNPNNVTLGYVSNQNQTLNSNHVDGSKIVDEDDEEDLEEQKDKVLDQILSPGKEAIQSARVDVENSIMTENLEQSVVHNLDDQEDDPPEFILNLNEINGDNNQKNEQNKNSYEQQVIQQQESEKIQVGNYELKIQMMQQQRSSEGQSYQPSHADLNQQQLTQQSSHTIPTQENECPKKVNLQITQQSQISTNPTTKTNENLTKITQNLTYEGVQKYKQQTDNDNKQNMSLGMNLSSENQKSQNSQNNSTQQQYITFQPQNFNNQQIATSPNVQQSNNNFNFKDKIKMNNEQQQYEQQVEEEIYIEKRYCSKCNQEQPTRTKHCKDCDKCVATHDHHCPWVGNCIGEKNRCNFWWYLLIQLIELIFPYFPLLENIGDESREGNKILLSTFVIIVVLFILSGFIFMVGILFIYHTYLATHNLTTWENASWDRISYLSEFPEAEGSPFSKGVIENLRKYCRWVNSNTPLIQWRVFRVKKQIINNNVNSNKNNIHGNNNNPQSQQSTQLSSNL